MDSAESAAGPAISGYRLLGLIGRGAIGEVHLAIDPTSSARVALKTMRLAGHAEDIGEARRSFLAEAGAARGLVHPGIVHVLAAGESVGLAWIAMELLAGCDLVRYTRAARLLPEPVALRVAERVALALVYAHGRGVVHRDIKPANVMVDWAADRVTLTDFGIARLADAERTRTGVVLGTPAYMAPEQLAGAAADASGDLYALGVMLFELLTGRRPHEGASMGELLRKVASEPAPDLRSLRPELPPAWAELLAKVLAKRPSERPADAAALAEALKGLREGAEAGAAGVAKGPKSRD